MTNRPRLTANAGAPVPGNQDALMIGPRGPVLHEDCHLVEKPAHQNCRRVPERVVHAKGWGAHGTFTASHAATVAG